MVTTNERENQLLLRCFSRRCQWANVVIRVHKCVTFGIKKFSSCSLQFQPELLINSEVVAPVKKDESFKYLGRFFKFEQSCDARCICHPQDTNYNLKKHVEAFLD